MMTKLVLLFLLLLPSSVTTQPVQKPSPVATPTKVEAPAQPATAVAEPKPPEPTPAPTQAVTPAPKPVPVAVAPQLRSGFSYSGGSLNSAQINALGNCESGMNPATNTGNSFYGAFQFTIPTWNAMGTGYARADLAPLDVQIMAVQKLLSSSSIYSQFPACARKMAGMGLL